MEKSIVCLYHAMCVDGLVSAWCLSEAYSVDKIEFIPVDYNSDFATKLAGKFDGKTVYIVDFSIEPQVLLPLIEDATKVYMIDHHQSAINKWDGHSDLPKNLELIFNSAHSGAMLTWKYLFGKSRDVPMLVMHAEDRDLWKFELPNTAEHISFLRAQPWLRLQNFEALSNHSDLYESNENYRNTVHQSGAAIALARNELIHDILKTSLNFVNILGHRIPVAAMPKAMHSEAGQILYELYADAPFVITYSDQRHRGMREYSFRSRKDGGANVRVIAEILHGGGHQHAAGVSVKLSDELMLENLTSLMVEERIAYRDEFYHKLEEVILKHWQDFTKEASGSRAAKDFFSRGLVGK